jgi:branched-subunit amino acid aminotransferase/4-amino-4-deoxychorismate lyase
MKYAIRNCELIPEEEAVVPVTRREVFFGFAVYESLKVQEGVPLFIDEHLDRLFESARVLRLAHTFRRDAIADSFRRLAAANELELATLRMLLVGGDEPEFYAYATELPTYPAEYYRFGAEAISYHGERIFPRAKSNSLLLNYIAGREAAERDALEALLVDRHGRALEGTRSNLFALRGGELITAGEDVLSGVTRKHILDSFEEEGGPIHYRKMALEKLLSGECEEVFISSTSMGALPLHSIDGRSLLPREKQERRRHLLSRPQPDQETTDPAEVLFPVTAHLNELLRQRTRREIERNG